MKGRLVTLSFFVALALIVAGCAPAATPTATPLPPPTKPAATQPPPAPTPKWTGPKYGGKLVVPVGLIPSLDIHSSVATVIQQTANAGWEGLLTLGEDFEIIPMLAEKWDVSPDAKTYTFHLRKGVKFCNGKEMTSADVVATFKRWFEISPRKAQLGTVESYDAPDAYTVRFQLSKPSSSFLTALAIPQALIGIFPKEIIEGKAADALKIPDDYIGTGPYKLVEYKPDELLRMVRNEYYEPLPGERDGLGGAKIPYFDEIVWRVVPEGVPATAGLETGDYDMVGLGATEYNQYQGRTDITVQKSLPTDKQGIVFNLEEKLTAQLKFRQAVNAAVDLESAALSQVEGLEDFVVFNYSLWPQHSYWYCVDPVAKQLYEEQDLEKAKRLLKEIGYAGEEVIIATMAPDSWSGRPCAVIAEDLKKAGMNVRVDVYDWPTLFDMWVKGGNWHISVNGWQTAFNVNPQAYRNMFDSRIEGTGTRYGYVNPEIDKLFDEAEATTTLEGRKQFYCRLQSLVWQDLAQITYGDYMNLVGMRSNVKGFVGWYRDRFWGVWREK